MVISVIDFLMSEELAAAVTTVWLTKAEAASHARVTVRTIDNWVKRGWLRAGGSPGLVLIKLEWLEHFLEHHRDGL